MRGLGLPDGFAIVAEPVDLVVLGEQAAGNRAEDKCQK